MLVDSPFAEIAQIVIRFWSLDKVTEVEKFPSDVGCNICWSESVITITVAPGSVFPETFRVLLVTTLSFIGWLIDKKIVGLGVGVGVETTDTDDPSGTTFVL